MAGLSWDPQGRLQLTPAGGFLGQLQAVDGEAVDPAAGVALLSLALHVALGFAGIGRLDLVPAVALGPEFQPRVQVTPAERGIWDLSTFPQLQGVWKEHSCLWPLLGSAVHPRGSFLGL